MGASMICFIRLALAFVIGVTVCGNAKTSHAQDFIGIGSGTIGNNLNSMSADGNSIVGASGTEAFRWSRSSGIALLGTLPGTSFSVAFGTNSDGSVVVGVSGNDAFRWSATGGMISLGHLPGLTQSIAYGTNYDGSVIVGLAYSNGTIEHAFRWTQSGGMVDLGLPSGAIGARAVATNSDGSVITGFGTLPSGGNLEAFRWTQATGFTPLGFLPGGSMSTGLAINASGDVIVGYGNSTAGYQALRWKSGAGMQALGFLPGGNNSHATATNGDGSIVVGDSNSGGNLGGYSAFRWTAATGMRSVADLLNASGVALGGWRLTNAYGISADGRFIAGQGINPAGNSEPWIALCCDTNWIGFLARSAAQRSVDNLATARMGALSQHHSLAAPLLGWGRQISAGSEVTAFAAHGSLSAGGSIRYSLGHGLALFGGLSFSRESYQDVDLTNSATIAGGVRYIHGAAPLRWFAEISGWHSPNSSFSFSRRYDEGTGSGVGFGSTSGSASYASVTSGLLYSPSRRSQIAIAAEFGRQQLSTRGYEELAGSGNPFAASIGPATDHADVAKLKLQMTQPLTSDIEGSIWVSEAVGFGRKSNLVAGIDGLGVFSPSLHKNFQWFEYGLRVGYHLSEASSVDVFANGISATSDQRMHIGFAYRQSF